MFIAPGRRRARQSQALKGRVGQWAGAGDPVHRTIVPGRGIGMRISCILMIYLIIYLITIILLYVADGQMGRWADGTMSALCRRRWWRWWYHVLHCDLVGEEVPHRP